MEEEFYLKPGSTYSNIQLKENKWLFDCFDKHNNIAVFFWTISCKPCLESMNHLNEILSEFDVSSMIGFVACDDETLNLISQGFSGKLNLYNIDAEALLPKYKVEVVPWTMVINSKGEIITSGIPGSKNKFKEILKPMGGLEDGSIYN